MKRHLKRQEEPKNWPITRKGSIFVIKNNSNGIPLLILLRDVMKIAQDRKEVKQAIHKKHLLICGKPVINEKKSLELFDILTLVPSKKNYRLVLSEKGKYDIEETSEKESSGKIAKILGKKSIKGKKTQINLSDGRNYISDLKCAVGDSVIIDFEKNKILKNLPIKEGSEVLITKGKYTGLKGKIMKIDHNEKMVDLDSSGKILRALIKQIMVLN